MKPTLSPFIFFVIFFSGCSSYDANKRIDALTERIDSLEKHALWTGKGHPEVRTFKFEWFDIGKDEFHFVGKVFYVTNIKTEFKQNGYQVSGVIANTSSMSIDNPIVECAIKDTTTKEKVVSGFSNAPNLFPGAKLPFNVFIPTTKSNVSEVGVLVRDYRM